MTPTGKGGRARIRTVDGLRGLAALLVVFDHTIGDSWGLGEWSQQNHGITAFALLTGFLLSSQFLKARLDRRPRPPMLTFLRARAARIFPGYWVALAIAAATVGLHAMGPGDGWRVVTLTQTFGTDTAFKGLPPTWSLSLFLSFYLALPVWAWWQAARIARIDRRRRCCGLRSRAPRVPAGERLGHAGETVIAATEGGGAAAGSPDRDGRN